MKQLTLFAAGLFLLSLSANGQVKNAKPAAAKPAATKPAPPPAKPAAVKPAAPKPTEEQSVEAIRRVFKDYLQTDGGTDLPENKETMRWALSALPDTVKKEELPLLVNVWMYYDPADFPVRDMVYPVFSKNLGKSLAAIEYRLKHKEKWETVDAAPYSDLVELEKRLKLSRVKAPAAK